MEELSELSHSAPTGSIGGRPAATYQRPFTVRLQLSDPELVDGLLAFLERMGVAVAPSEIETIVDLPVQDGERRELERFIRLWLAMHPNVEVALVD